jgi:hypothetical protein
MVFGVLRFEFFYFCFCNAVSYAINYSFGDSLTITILLKSGLPPFAPPDELNYLLPLGADGCC